jgi:hypothetical protein
MLFARRKPDDITGTDFADLAAGDDPFDRMSIGFSPFV